MNYENGVFLIRLSNTSFICHNSSFIFPSEVLLRDFPTDKNADDATETADDKLTEKTESHFFAEPPADPAADGDADPDEEFGHARNLIQMAVRRKSFPVFGNRRGHLIQFFPSNCNPLVLQHSGIPTFHYRMDFDWLIIDGYNLMHQDDALDGRRSDLPTARQRLVRRIEKAATGMAHKISVVFDGREGGRDEAFDAPHLEVLFSPSNRTADGLIEQMVHDAKKPERVLVVTSDWTEQRLVSVFGASVISCREFLLRCETSPSLPKKPKSARGSTLGDFFPGNNHEK